MEFEVGDILLFNWDNWFAKLTRCYNFISYGNSGWSHSGIVTQVTNKDILVHEAISNGFVSSYYPKKFVEEHIEKGIIDIGKPNKLTTDIFTNAEKYLGRGYSWLDVINILWLFIFQTRRFKWFQGGKHLICSEAVARILYDSSNKKIDFEKEFKKPFDEITPMDLYFSKHINW